MLFHNAIPYHLSKFAYLVDELEAALAAHEFTPCGGLEAQRIGWVRIRDTFAHQVGDYILVQLRTETKVLPAKAIRKLVADKVAEIEEREGVRVGRRLRREIESTIIDERLPSALVEHRHTRAWIAPDHGWIVVEAASAGAAELLLRHLDSALPDGERLRIALPQVMLSPNAAMTGWLADNEAPAGFTIDRDCELRLPGEDKATVRYVRHALDGDDISEHIAAGKQATRLGMTWADRVSFVLTEHLRLKRIQFLDVLTEQLEQAEDANVHFDAELALGAGEMTNLLADLVQALGGLEKENGNA